jgi:hypothetical protein
VTRRRGGRPRGPERVPFTTNLLPDARDELTRRAVETYGTERAANRVIEEAMGYAAVQDSETEEVDIWCEREDWDDDCTVTVRLYRAANDEIESVQWHGEGSGPLTPAEEERAREAARRKAAES